MGTPIDREGHFRARIVEYGMCQASDAASQSVGVQIKVALTEMWDPDREGWMSWSEYDQEATGTLWIVKKDGTLNDMACRSLVQNAGWDGDIYKIADSKWEPTECQVTIKAEEYRGRTQYKVSFVNDYNRVPGSMGTLDESTVKSLKNQHGSALRALFATTKANSAPKPEGKPEAPPKPPAKRPPPAGSSVGIPDEGAPPQDEVPF